MSSTLESTRDVLPEPNANASSGLDNLNDIREALDDTSTDSDQCNPGNRAPQAIENNTTTTTNPFPFFRLPLEIRELIYTHWASTHIARTILHRHVHYNTWDKPCCFWSWPSELVLCGKWNTIQHPSIAFFLPPFCFANRQLRNEVANHMLRYTESVVFKCRTEHPRKISKYFLEFLQDVKMEDGGGAISQVHELNFPHMYNYTDVSRRRRTGENSDITLMTTCPNIWTVRMTFHASHMTVRHAEWGGIHLVRPVDDILDHYRLRPILQCKELKEVFLDGVRPRVAGGYPVDPLEGMKELGLWMKRGFAGKGMETKIWLRRRADAWRGGHYDWVEL